MKFLQSEIDNISKNQVSVDDDVPELVGTFEDAGKAEGPEIPDGVEIVVSPNAVFYEDATQ